MRTGAPTKKSGGAARGWSKRGDLGEQYLPSPLSACLYCLHSFIPHFIHMHTSSFPKGGRVSRDTLLAILHSSLACSLYLNTPYFVSHLLHFSFPPPNPQRNATSPFLEKYGPHFGGYVDLICLIARFTFHSLRPLSHHTPPFHGFAS